MRFLIDESVNGHVARALSADHDILLPAAATLIGASDPVVARRAAELDRILIAEDRDFGPLCLSMKPPKASVIMFLLEGLNRTERIQRTLEALNSPGYRFDGFVTNVDANNIRQRAL